VPQIYIGHANGGNHLYIMHMNNGKRKLLIIE
jgi:hypothetical protein